MSPEYAAEVTAEWKKNLQWLLDMATGVDGGVDFIRLRFNSEQLLATKDAGAIREFEKINNSIRKLKILSQVGV